MTQNLRGSPVGFGRNSNPENQNEKVEREKAKAEANALKSAERKAKAQQRLADKKIREEEKVAKEKRELENYGKKILEEACAGKLVRIYDKGYVRVSGVFLKDGAVFEKLKAISSSADVAKKTALGRTIMAGATMGLNLVTTPNKRGDMYLTITTDRTTHMLHMSPPTEREMKAMHKIANAGQGILDSIERQSPNFLAKSGSSQLQQPQQSVSPTSLIDELTKLVALRDAGALTDDEFTIMKTDLMAGKAVLPENVDSDGNADPSSTQQLFDVELVDARLQLIEAIVVVRRFTSLGLAEAKRIVESAPSIVGTSLSQQTATEFVEALRATGAIADLR